MAVSAVKSSMISSQTSAWGSHRRARGSRISNGRRRAQRHLFCETLEARQLLAGNVSPGDGWVLGGGGLQDTDTGLVWSIQLPVQESWSYDYANTQIQNLTEGGQTDWRLPTKAELEEAMAHGLENHHGELDSYWHWTSTVGNKRTEHWLVNNAGSSISVSNGWNMRAIAVRGTRDAAGYTTPNIRVYSTSLVTGEIPANESGEYPASNYLTVALDTAPTADVVVSMHVDDPTEGLLATSGSAQSSSVSLTFTPANWNVPQWVSVAGVDDPQIDGDVTYHIVLGPAQSLDPDYHGLDPTDITVINRDNEAAYVIVTPTSGLVTTESGGTAQFTMKLHSQPNGNVYVNLASSNVTEGLPSAAQLSFTPANWNVPQAVVVTGLDDLVADGDMPYQIITSIDPTSSWEFLIVTPYSDPNDVSLTNADNDLVNYTQNSGTLNVSIPDPGTIISQMTVSNSFTIQDVNVKVNINHTYDRDMRVYLIGPDSTRVELFTDVGGSGDNFINTVLDDEATALINAGAPAVAPFTGSFRPEGALSSFDGKIATGTWKLEVTDAAKRDRGTLVNWSLIFSGAPSPLLADATGPGTSSATLWSADLPAIVDRAVACWHELGASSITTRDLDIRIADLGGRTLGLASGDTIWLDDDAAGWGWFVDPTPSDDAEFTRSGDQGEQNHMDLLTVVMHELGHLLGHAHDQDGLMAETLSAGVRHTDLDHDHLAAIDQVLAQAPSRDIPRGIGSWFADLPGGGRSHTWAKRRR